MVIPHLNGGGAARVSRNLALGLSRRGYEVHLAAVTGDHGEWRGAPDISLHCLGAARVRWSAPALVRLIRRLKPDAVLSNMAHLNLLVLALQPAFPRKTRILVRNDGGIRADRLAPLAETVWRRLHRRADAIVCQSDAMAADFVASLGAVKTLRVLPNPVDFEQVRRNKGVPMRWDSPGPNLLAIGRLVSPKGFDLLLSAFAAVLFNFPSARVVLLGDGAELNELQRLARKLGIADRVLFAGRVAGPEEWFPGATLYVQPSREDALPNALLEAAAAGLPIAVTPARGGLPALLNNQAGCWIAPEITALSLAHTITEALRSLASGQRFAHTWVEPFAMSNAIERYDALIREVHSA